MPGDFGIDSRRDRGDLQLIGDGGPAGNKRRQGRTATTVGIVVGHGSGQRDPHRRIPNEAMTDLCAGKNIRGVIAFE
jgi:hypothetical protein